MSRIYGWLAGAAILLVVIGAIYGKGRIDASHKAEIATLEQSLADARRSIEVEKAARQNDAILAAENARRAAVLNHKIDELTAYAESLEDADRECLSGADVERLRSLWQ